MNKLTVAEYLKNRQAYKDRLEKQKEAGKKNPSGRAEEGSKAQKEAREEALRDKIDELLEEKGLTEEEASEEAKKEIEDKAAEWMKTQAALHDPDQIAGGNPENITGKGNARVNSSIGSQWKYRADDVEEQVREYLEKKQIPEEEWDSIYLNINMPYKFV